VDGVTHNIMFDVIMTTF